MSTSCEPVVRGSVQIGERVIAFVFTRSSDSNANFGWKKPSAYANIGFRIARHTLRAISADRRGVLTIALVGCEKVGECHRCERYDVDESTLGLTSSPA